MTFLLIQYANSHDNGETGHTNKSGETPGCNCHCQSANTSTIVKIETSATSFQVGQKYTFTLTVTNVGESDAGCDISVKRGTLTAGSDGLKNSGTQLTHKSPKALPAVWTFIYTAPATAGGDTIYAVGNAVNGDGRSGSNGCSDEYDFAPKFVINVGATSTKAISLSRNTIVFPSKRVGTSISDTIKINSSGNSDLTIASSTLVAGTSFSCLPSIANRTITGGQSETETIDFHPKARGKFTDTLVIKSDATVTNDQRKAVLVTGVGIAGEFGGSNILNFGSQHVGSKTLLAYRITNTGDDTLFINSKPTSSGKGFSLESNASFLNIPPGVTDSVILGFLPDARGSFSGNLNFTALNNIIIPTISLIGKVIAPQISIPDTIILLSAAKIDKPDTVALKISNIGEDTLHVTGVIIVNTKQGAKFAISGLNILNIFSSLNADVSVIYVPTTVGKDTAILSIASDDLISLTKQVMIIGEGVNEVNSVKTISQISEGQIVISPNPSPGTGMIKISLQKALQLNVELINAGGRVIHRFEKSEFDAGESLLPLSDCHLTNGHYYMRAISNGRILGESSIVILR